MIQDLSNGLFMFDLFFLLRAGLLLPICLGWWGVSDKLLEIFVAYPHSEGEKRAGSGRVSAGAGSWPEAGEKRARNRRIAGGKRPGSGRVAGG